jgi:hypothetical protein
MVMTIETIEAPLAPEQLARRWQELCEDPTFEDISAKIELTGNVLSRGHCLAVCVTALLSGLKRTLRAGQ